VIAIGALCELIACEPNSILVGAMTSLAAVG